MFNFKLYCLDGLPKTAIVTPNRVVTSTAEILYSNKAPIGWDKMNYSFIRDEQLIGLISKFTDTLNWVGEVKDWIDDIYDRIGLNAQIKLYVTVFDPSQRKFVYLFDGILNFSSYSKKEKRSSLNIEESLFYQTFKNRDSLELNIQNVASCVTSISEPLGITFNKITGYDILIKGVTEKHCIAYKPCDLFSTLITLMTGSTIGFKSPLFESGGVLEFVMITTGKFIRGFNEDSTTLSISFNTLFNFFKNVYCLGLSIEVDSENNPYIYIDYYDYFFKRVLVHEVTNPSKLEIAPNTKHTFGSIESGYAKYENKQNDSISGKEYNRKAIYTTPINAISTKLDIKSPIRGDGTAIQLLIDNSISTQLETSSNNLDNEIFYVDCYLEGNQITSKGLERFSLFVDDSTGGTPSIVINAENTPKRILQRWYSLIGAGLQKDQGKYLRVNKGDNLTQIRSRLLAESEDVVENEDILISTLAEPYISGDVARFDLTLNIEDIIAIKLNPHGLLKFYDYINKRYIYGWLGELPSKPIDKITNAELIIASSFVIETALKPKLKLLGGGYLRQLNAGYIFLLNNN